MIAILNLINKYFWKSFFGPFFAFIFPLVFIGILGSIFSPSFVLPGAFYTPTIAIALMALPQGIFEFKRSVLLKRIGATNIKPWVFMFVTVSYYVVIMLIAWGWTMAMSLAILYPTHMVVGSPDNILEMYQQVNWGATFFCQFYTMILASSIGIMFVSIVRSSVAIQALGMILFTVTEFLAFQVVPATAIKDSDVLWYISYIVPFRYTTAMGIESWWGSNNFWNGDPFPGADLPPILPTNIFQPNSPFISVNITFNDLTSFGSHIVVFDSTDKWLDLFMPLLFIGFSLLVSLKKFKWNVR